MDPPARATIYQHVPMSFVPIQQPMQRPINRAATPSPSPGAELRGRSSPLARARQARENAQAARRQLRRKLDEASDSACTT